MRFLRVKPEVDSRLCCVVIGNAYRKSSVCDRGLKMLSNPVLSIRLGVTADLDPTVQISWRIWTPLRRFGPPYQTFLLSILCIIFGN